MTRCSTYPELECKADCEKECFAAKVATVHLGEGCRNPGAGKNAPAAKSNPAWERGIAGEHRPGGFFSPYIHEGSGTPIHVKEFSEKRNGPYGEQIKRLKSDPNVYEARRK